ncbi:WD40 repeat-like protein [Suhomyces tanzawaensis NRRL Y-17324]|uniref:WD40 repeat-like protein n=1 Tax=Suhomyces tanzawaensis NRRL Y-17324 TaxID=984487 RepID=A0A1E4SQQ0_9ASCO|nr:WD40 repeat-like protein [Suhomyces tanzawaensis NRRL Y-17324]ODV81834.1 WD40 repeat-like protein [Suhomyces tanzawaensis NRRL Y-17324]
MSLTSNELNYLVWRYLQESGYDLAAYALDKHSSCLDYESAANQHIIDKFRPGCLVELVQKGILYSVAQEEAETHGNGSSELNFSLWKVLISEDVANVSEETDSPAPLTLKSAVANGDVEMADAAEDAQEAAEDVHEPVAFHTAEIVPEIRFDESLVADWHPTTPVFAYGKQDSVAVINAIKDGRVAESVTLSHPQVLNDRNEINVVSWSPQGNLIITAGINGELRAWSPDGKLKNIANTFSGDISPEDAIQLPPPSLISSLIWNHNGQLLLSLDCNNQVSLWDGTTLSLIKQIRPPEAADSSLVIDACWLDENKFAVSTTKFSIKIYSITHQPFGGSPDVHTMGYLNGHENSISILKFNPQSKLLASCSDYNYAIKVWSRGSSQECLDLNKKSDLYKNHTSPLIDLHWLSKHHDDSILLTVSMDGVLNIWNASNGNNLKSVDLFKNEANFRVDEDSPVSHRRDLLVFTTALSPDLKLLAVGDDLGRVTVWDLSLSGPKDLLRCLGIYHFEVQENKDAKDGNTGICDLKWDSSSKHICVSYKGTQSVIFKWDTPTKE